VVKLLVLLHVVILIERAVPFYIACLHATIDTEVNCMNNILVLVAKEICLDFPLRIECNLIVLRF
jgi:hypothetical protein